MNKKKFLMIGLPILLMTLVAGALTYYAMFYVTLNVHQPISVTGSLTQTINDCDAGETCVGQGITVSNSGDEARTVKIVKDYGDGNIAVSYVGKLELTKKDSSWTAVGDPIEITYTVVGDTFEFSGVPEGYTLIYYKDKVTGLDERLDNPQPAITVTSDIGSLPQLDDANIDDLANYCQDPDNYLHCKGAKLWVVSNGDLADENLNWANMFNGYYYETDLIYYFDNANGEITIPAGSFIEFYPAFTPDQYIGDGAYEFGFEVQ